MLKKNKRLNLNKDFSWVSAGQKGGTTSFRLFYRHGKNSLPKVGIALSKRSFPKSHDRHRAQRLSAQAASAIYTDLSKTINLVIMPKPTVLKIPTLKLVKELSDIKDLFANH